MTQFIKAQFQVDGAYVRYDNKFVARFKHQRNAKGSFITFLVKNFTVEEYFAAMASGLAPLQVVEPKGYILPHIKKWLKEAKLPQTREGYAMFMSKVYRKQWLT